MCLNIYINIVKVNDKELCNFLVLTTICVCGGNAKELTEIEALASQPNKCTYEYAFEMYGAHCGGLRLSKIPSLRSGVEILDFSENKLRELHKGTFADCTGVRFLYLADNQIYRVDEDAFASLSYLETLDLSRNVIIDLPESMFQLASLRKLYLSGNPLYHMNGNFLIIGKPIKAPLELLDMSDCQIKELPDWGFLPQLIFYNISHNPLKSLPAKHFAVLCNLQRVDLTESIDNINSCNLKPTILWLRDYQVSFTLNDYSRLNSNEFDRCSKMNIEDSSVLNSTYHKCKNEYSQVSYVMKTSRRTWLTVGGGLAGFLICFILLLYVVHRHNVAQIRSAEKKAEAEDGDKQATATLLMNVK